jgi:hypothetical protein
VPAISPIWQLTGENSKYGLRKAITEYMRELSTIKDKNENYTDIDLRVKYGLFTPEFQTEKKNK